MPKTLLLADDSVTIQKVVGLSFASEDVTLITVSNGDDALIRAREVRPDLVLADVVMPGKNGYEVCEAIKGDPALRHIPVLLLTGTFEAFDQERARRAGADGHVTKPFEAQALVQQVKDLMARGAAPVQAAAPAPAFAAVDAPSFASLELQADAPALAGTAAEMADDPFFDEDLPEPSFGSESLDIDVDAAAGELELATVVEEDAIGGPIAETDDFPSLASQPAVDLSRSVAGATEIFEVGQHSFRGSPVFSSTSSPSSTPRVVLEPFDDDLPAAITETDALSPRAAAPAPANVLPDDDFGFDLDEPSFVTAPPAAQASSGSHAAPPDLFGDDDPTDGAALDPARAEAFDLSFTDLDDPLAAARGDLATPEPPRSSERPPTAAAHAFESRPAAPIEPPQATAFESEFSRSFEPEPERAFDAQPSRSFEQPPTAVSATASASSSTNPTVDLSPVLRQRLHDTLEKVAWEAFSDLSDTIVRQALERIESIAWEVIPQLAEQLIREEIRRMKGDGEES